MMENYQSGNSELEEQRLVARLRAGDPAAVDEVVNRYQQQLYAFILRLVHQRETAEDLFQETWIRVLRSLPSFRGEARFSTWLFQIALNLCRNLARQHARREFVELEEAGPLSEEPAVDGERLLQARKLRKLVDSLPEKMREVVVLRYYHGFSDLEIAEIAELPAGTVKSRLHRATAMLREKIEATAGALSPANEEVDHAAIR